MRNSQDSDYIPGGLYLTSTGKECLAPYAKPNKMKTFQVLCYQSIGGSGGDTLQPTPPSEEIKYILQVITGNTYFLDLSAPDMGDVIQARVIDGTGQVVSSNVQFKSYDPSLVNVAEDGALSPVSSSVGSTIVEISYPQANSVNVSVAVGQLTVGTRYLSQTVVQSWDATTGELSVANTAETTDIQIGKVILQLRYGIMAKVNEIEEREDGIVYKTVPASLVETYETLKAEVVVPMPSYPKRKAARSISDFLSDLECESEASFPGVSLSDAHAEAINDVQLIAKIDLGFFKVNSFSLVAEARAGIKADTGSITLSSSSNSKLNCKTNLDKYEIGELSLPIPGTIIFIGPQITPVLGLEASAEFNGPSLTYKGPSFEEGYVVTAGIEYTHSGGFRPVSSEERFGSGLQWGSFSSALTVGFKSMMEIFAGFKFGAFAGVGCCSLTCKLEYPKLCISLTDFDFALARVGAGTELGISSPLSKLSYGYTGPEWGVYVRLYLGADPLLEHLEQFGKLLERIGIDQVNIEFDPKFFDERKYIYESPKPKVTFVSATPDGSWQVSVETGGTTSSRGEVLAFLNTNSDGQSVGQGMLQDGKGTIKIQGLKFGTYELKAETESFFGPSFPYSSNRSHQILAAPPDTGDGDGGSGDPGTGGDGGTGDDGGSGDPGTGGDGDTQSPNVNAECAQESPYYMSYDYSTTDAIFNACVALWNVDPTLLNDAGIGMYLNTILFSACIHTYIHKHAHIYTYPMATHLKHVLQVGRSPVGLIPMNSEWANGWDHPEFLSVMILKRQLPH